MPGSRGEVIFCSARLGESNQEAALDVNTELLTGVNGFEGVVAIDKRLELLTAIDPRQSRPIELRLFAGLSIAKPG